MKEARASIDEVISQLCAAGCVFAEDEARLLTAAADTKAELNDLVSKRVSGVPLEYLLGWVEFAGLHIAVGPGVFVPRRRTEFLAEQAISLLRRRRTEDEPVRRPDGQVDADRADGDDRNAARIPHTDRGPARGSHQSRVVVDLCCGTGAVAAAVASAITEADVYAADVDPTAIEYAGRNLAGRGTVLGGDLYDALPASLRGRIDVLTANAPYVPTDAIALMPPEARLHEPRATLDGGADGLDIARRIARGANDWLVPGGILLIETSDEQASHLAEAAGRYGLTPWIVSDDDRAATVVIADAAKPSRSVPKRD